MIRPRNIFGYRAARSQMGPSPPSILFVSHDASRTGAPIALLTFLRWLRANTDYRFEVLLGCGGPLEPAFEALAPTTNADVAAGRFLGHLSASVPQVLLNVWPTGDSDRSPGACPRPILCTRTPSRTGRSCASCGTLGKRCSLTCTSWNGG